MDWGHSRGRTSSPHGGSRMTSMDSERAHRDVPLGVLRDWYRDQVELSSVRSLAAEANVGRTTIHKFVHGATKPHPRVRRLLALHYLQATGEGRVENVRPLQAALGVMLARVPAERITESISEVLDTVERVHRAAAVEPPGWIAPLREWRPGITR